MRSPQPTQEDILRAPASESTQLNETHHGFFIGEVSETFQVQMPFGDRTSQLNHGAALLETEPELSQFRWDPSGQIYRGGEGMNGLTGRVQWRAVGCGQAIKEVDAQRK